MLTITKMPSEKHRKNVITKRPKSIHLYATCLFFNHETKFKCKAQLGRIPESPVDARRRGDLRQRGPLGHSPIPLTHSLLQCRLHHPFKSVRHLDAALLCLLFSSKAAPSPALLSQINKGSSCICI